MTAPLPELYARWVYGLLGALPAREQKATCHDCAMCVKPDGSAPNSVVFFEPDVKCCVYMPRLPNFLVGRILADETPSREDGRQSVRARIAGRVGVDPLGLDRPPSYEFVYRGVVNAVGRSRSLRCPHFVERDGSCGIWANRDAMCTTWFCHHDRGLAGASFWRGLGGLLAVVEEEVSRWCALQLGVPPGVAGRRLTPRSDEAPKAVPGGPEADGVVDEATWAAMWGGWNGWTEAFYLACAERVDRLDWPGVLAICGTEVAIRAASVIGAWSALYAEPPERLRLGSFQIVGQRTDAIRVSTYSVLDTLDLPSQLLPLLPLFDGRPTADIIGELRDAYGVEIDPRFLRQLVDWRVLIPG